ncbi:MAG TPA: hydantoinase B/oxoprolinase family protein [Alphaproteobacteria bacterium]|nr:hydantoinase B/oxoprolinase family protein [Alphaproteobacteria bacterium]
MTKAVDPVTLEVLRNALPAIAAEMAVDLQRTSYNMMIYEVQDFCCALLDAEGHLISQNIGGVSHFVADLGVVIKDGLNRYGKDGFAPGDVVITNHQRVAGQHLNNVCIYSPVFAGGALQAFAVVRAHWVDIGGLSTGFSAASMVVDPWMEGLQLDQIKIYEGGKPDEKALRIIRDNIRFPEAAMGDLRSQIAACKLAERRLDELFTRYGCDTIYSAIERIFDETERKCRNVVRGIPDGVYEAESFLDPDTADKTQTVPIKVKVIVKGDDMTIDLTGCSPQRKSGLNGRTLAGPYIAYKGLTGALEPVNEGSFRALKVEIQEGNFMMARYPAVMASWSRALPTVVDTILKALAPALPERIPAAHLGTLGGSMTFFGHDSRKGRDFVLQTIEGGGWGARPWEDGESAVVSVCQGDVRNAPIETIELKTPVIVDRRGLRNDSGGPGKFRGGLGIITQMTNLSEGRWSASNAGRRMCAPWGIAGGKSGTTSRNYMRNSGENDFKPFDPTRVLSGPGAAVRVETAGGGGWGSPLDREPEKVLNDVLDEFVSIESARENYGVVIDPRTRTVDASATSALRAVKRAGSGKEAKAS